MWFLGCNAGSLPYLLHSSSIILMSPPQPPPPPPITAAAATLFEPQLVSTLTLRKSATVVSFCIAALFLLLTGFIPRDNGQGHTWAVLFLTVAVAGLGIGTAGWDVNALGTLGV